MEKININIVGAGVIGLAIGAELSGRHKDIIIIDKNDSFGRETSSRNSEVIHAGIYYPKNSLKAKACLAGRPLLYEFCAKNNIPHRRIGKLIVANSADESRDLEKLLKQGLDNGVDDLKIISRDEIKIMEPNIQAERAIYSPSTGIIDSHKLMAKLAARFTENGGQLAYNTELAGIDRVKDGFEVTVYDQDRNNFRFFTRVLINCAGLNSDKVAALAGIAKDEYRLKYCKGDYFRVSPNKAKLINRLIYPVPKKEGAGLGIHATLDLAGGLRLGPDDEYVDKIDYRVEPSKREKFYQSARQFLPFIELVDFTPDTSGIRPKLQGRGEALRDFIIKNEADNGVSGLINLIGIESPGLTACLSIAKIIDKYLSDFFS